MGESMKFTHRCLFWLEEGNREKSAMYNEIKDTIKEAYNKYAHLREKNGMQDWKIEERNSFLELMKSENKTSLLDIGAGHGRDSAFFMNNGIDVVAVDLSNEMIKLCSEKNIEAYELDFYNLHQLNRSFDTVWAMNSLLHVEKSNLPSVLQGIKNVLRPSGLFFMGVYGGDSSEGIWENDIYTPHRFFSSYTDDDIKNIVSKQFELVSFEKIETGGKYHVQSIIMRNTL